MSKHQDMMVVHVSRADFPKPSTRLTLTCTTDKGTGYLTLTLPLGYRDTKAIRPYMMIGVETTKVRTPKLRRPAPPGVVVADGPF
jgi:opacity protein-like surface antigen